MNFGKLAALKLCSLHKDDMYWILRQLTREQREMLSGYFDELEQWEGDNARQDSPNKASKLASRSPQEALCSLPADLVQAALETLPKPVQAKILAMADWPWKVAVESRLGMKPSQLSPVPSKLHEWLVDEVLARADI